MPIETIALIGSGTMGRGIAYAAATGGFRTILHDVAADALERLEPEQELGGAAGEADFVIEAVPEDIALKLRTFARLDERCREDVVLATNTSALSITEIAAATRRPARVVGMHFFNPVPRMKPVEVVKALDTGADRG